MAEWKLVPMHPSEAMLAAGLKVVLRYDDAANAYRAMLAAAPTPQEDGQMRRVSSAVEQYRNAPFRSADWLAGELMTILDTVPANDTVRASVSGDQ